MRLEDTHLLVEIGCPSKVGHSRVDTAAKILKNHGACILLLVLMLSLS